MRSNLCSHLRALLCPEGYQDSELAPLIGRLQDLLDNDPDRFKEAAESIAKLSVICLSASGIRPDLDRVDFRGINVIPKIPSTGETNPLFSDFFEITGPYSILNKVLSLPLLPEPMHIPQMRIISGLTKLKSAYPKDKHSLSNREVDRIFRSITDPAPVPSHITRDWSRFLDLLIPLLVRERGLHKDVKYDPVPFRPRSDKMSLAVVFNKRGKVASFLKRRSDSQVGNLSVLLCVPEIRNLYRQFREEFCRALLVGDDIGEWHIKDKFLTCPPVPFDQINVGYIKAIPNDGFKFRVVAVPVYGINSLCYPLEQKLMALCRSGTIQGVISHENTCKEIQKSMEKRKARIDSGHQVGLVESIDMTSFTDRLPYKGWQDQVLFALMKHKYISEFDVRAYDLMVNGSWHFLPGTEYQTTARYVGTPMGTYPSFPLASLTNECTAILAQVISLNRTFGGNIGMKTLIETALTTDIGKIIGDDTVIYDSDTAANYHSLMKSVGVPMSPDKCIKSHLTVEFCSKIINHLGIFEMKKIGPDNLGPTSLRSLHTYTYYGRGSKYLDEEILNGYGESRNFEILRECVYPFGLDSAPPSFSKRQRGSLVRTASMVMSVSAMIGKYIPMTSHGFNNFHEYHESFRLWIDEERSRSIRPERAETQVSVILSSIQEEVKTAMALLEQIFAGKPLPQGFTVHEATSWAVERVARSYDTFMSLKLDDPIFADRCQSTATIVDQQERKSLIELLLSSPEYDDWNEQFVQLNLSTLTLEGDNHERIWIPRGFRR